MCIFVLPAQTAGFRVLFDNIPCIAIGNTFDFNQRGVVLA